MSDNKTKTHVKTITKEDALAFHEQGKPGKIAIVATKPLTTQRDLSLAYSPGVAEPCKAIKENPDDAYKYTTKGNFVAVITNGTAVLGLGKLGALASKPVMEGKAVLFKRFADIDAIDLELDTEDSKEFINTVKNLAPSFGGINLEDIAAPECFEIEEKLSKLVDIPVFHDDQHGTAVISAAGIINACHLTDRKIETLKVVVNGAGAAAVACSKLILKLGVKQSNLYMCDRQGVIYKGRKNDMNKIKEQFENDTKYRTLTEALEGADVFLGLSAAGALKKEMVINMAPKPIIFAMANPVPEIMPEEAKKVRPDAIIATGRSDYQNQVNNVLGFPYIFRGALDVRASTINEDMKLAAAYALAELAREPVPEEVSAAYSGNRMSYGPDYIIPVPFDPRLISRIPIAVAKAAILSGVARIDIKDWDNYAQTLKARLNPSENVLNLLFGRLRNNPEKMLFVSENNQKILNAVKFWYDSDYGTSVILAKHSEKEDLLLQLQSLGITDMKKIEIHFIDNDPKAEVYIQHLYKKLQRRGYLYSDCVKMVKDDKHVYATCLLESNYCASAIVASHNNYRKRLAFFKDLIGANANKKIFGFSMAITRDKAIFIGDTALTELSSSEELAQVTKQLAQIVKKIGFEPRVALVSFSNFGDQLRTESLRIKKAKELLDNDDEVDFEYDGEMSVDVALTDDLLKLYPFSNLTAPANILIMPGLHSAHISTHLLASLGETKIIGPILIGLNQSIQIAPTTATTTDLINLAAFAALFSKENLI